MPVSPTILPTVIVHREGGKGYRIINESDFDPAKHRIYFDPADAKPEPQVSGAEIGGGFFSDRELRDMIEAETGARPGPRTLRENLIAQYEALTASEG